MNRGRHAPQQQLILQKQPDTTHCLKKANFRYSFTYNIFYLRACGVFQAPFYKRFWPFGVLQPPFSFCAGAFVDIQQPLRCDKDAFDVLQAGFAKVIWPFGVLQPPFHFCLKACLAARHLNGKNGLLVFNPQVDFAANHIEVVGGFVQT